MGNQCYHTRKKPIRNTQKLNNARKTLITINNGAHFERKTLGIPMGIHMLAKFPKLTNSGPLIWYNILNKSSLCFFFVLWETAAGMKRVSNPRSRPEGRGGWKEEAMTAKRFIHVVGKCKEWTGNFHAGEWGDACKSTGQAVQPSATEVVPSNAPVPTMYRANASIPTWMTCPASGHEEWKYHSDVQ